MATAPVFDKKNILVTGGAGFIGSFLCEKLLATSRVICLDSFVSSQESNIDHLLKYPDFEFIRHDITQPIDLDAYPELARFKLKFQGIQEVYNLACPMSVKNFDAHKLDILHANSIGVRNVLDLVVKYQSKMLQASSSVIYGSRDDGHDRPFHEDDDGSIRTTSPRACQDEGKRFAETACSTYAQVHKLDIKIARLFRTYGPRMPLADGHMIPDFIVSALDNKELVIFGDETMKTTLTFVSDIVDGMIKLMSAPANIGPVNLGSDLGIPIMEVAQRIIEMTGSQSRVSFQPPMLFMTPLSLPDIVKAKDRLGWLPLVGIDEGLKQTIDYTIAHKGLLGFRLG